MTGSWPGVQGPLDLPTGDGGRRPLCPARQPAPAFVTKHVEVRGAGHWTECPVQPSPVTRVPHPAGPWLPGHGYGGREHCLQLPWAPPALPSAGETNSLAVPKLCPQTPSPNPASTLASLTANRADASRRVPRAALRGAWRVSASIVVCADRGQCVARGRRGRGDGPARFPLSPPTPMAAGTRCRRGGGRLWAAHLCVTGEGGWTPRVATTQPCRCSASPVGLTPGGGDGEVGDEVVVRPVSFRVHQFVRLVRGPLSTAGRRGPGQPTGAGPFAGATCGRTRTVGAGVRARRGMPVRPGCSGTGPYLGVGPPQGAGLQEPGSWALARRTGRTAGERRPSGVRCSRGPRALVQEGWGPRAYGPDRPSPLRPRPGTSAPARHSCVRPGTARARGCSGAFSG